MAIASRHQVSPYVHDPSTTRPGEQLHDYDRWSTEGPMERAETLVQLERWKSRHGAD
jgi:hypothetical protein